LLPTKQKPRPPAVSAALRITQSAVIAAMLLAGKFALSGIPNVEIVTVIIAVAAFCFPPTVTLSAVLVFCTVEWLLYGFGDWVVSYYIYWSLLALVFMPLKLFKNPIVRTAIAAVIAVVMSALFGVLTSAVHVLFYTKFTSDFWLYFFGYYTGGAVFYITQIVSNAVIVPALFYPVTAALKRAKIGT
jgi:phosphate starvation-inducible membrane PsiE